MAEAFLWVTSDAVLFVALQAALALFVALAAVVDFVHVRRASRGSVTLTVTRSERSLAAFYGVYGTVSAVLVGLTWSVDVASTHRVFWTVADVLMVAYLSVWNGWFRNKLAGWAGRIPSLEKR